MSRVLGDDPFASFRVCPGVQNPTEQRIPDSGLLALKVCAVFASEKGGGAALKTHAVSPIKPELYSRTAISDALSRFADCMWSALRARMSSGSPFLRSRTSESASCAHFEMQTPQPMQAS